MESHFLILLAEAEQRERLRHTTGRRRLMQERATHAEPRRWIQAVRRFLGPSHRQLRADLPLGDLSESEVLVERTVPWHISEGRERQTLETQLAGPTVRRVNEAATDSLALDPWQDRDLLDVGVLVDHIDKQVAHG